MYTNTLFKGTVSKISSYPPCKDGSVLENDFWTPPPPPINSVLFFFIILGLG